MSRCPARALGRLPPRARPCTAGFPSLKFQLLSKELEKQSNIGNHSEDLPRPAITHLGWDCRIDIDTNDLHPSGQHVSYRNGMEHGAKAQHDTGSLKLCGIRILRP